MLARIFISDFVKLAGYLAASFIFISSYGNAFIDFLLNHQVLAFADNKILIVPLVEHIWYLRAALLLIVITMGTMGWMYLKYSSDFGYWPYLLPVAFMIILTLHQVAQSESWGQLLALMFLLYLICWFVLRFFIGFNKKD